MPDLTALSTLREAATDYPCCSHYLDYSKCRNAVTLLNAVTDALIAELEAAREVVAAASVIQYSEHIVHGKAGQPLDGPDTPWGDTESCDLCALRAALANHKEATR